MSTSCDAEDRKPFASPQSPDDRKPPLPIPADSRTRCSDWSHRRGGRSTPASDWSARPVTAAAPPSHWRFPHDAASLGRSRALPLWLPAHQPPASLPPHRFRPSQWVWPRTSAYHEAPPRTAPTDWSFFHVATPHWLSPSASTSGWLPPDDTVASASAGMLQKGRSNKGASKQRRDQINAEIATMRDLLPLPETARQRLSQLQIMSLSCVYIRKCNVLQKLFRAFPADKDVPTTCDFFQALTGFLLITTREGKLVYISENVTDYLGHSMVDMKTQGDSLYDIVDKRDHGTVQAQLLQGGADLDVTQDVAFFCRMNMSRTLKRQAGFGDVKVMHVRGHFIPLSDPDSDGNDQQQHQQQKYVFMATCSPLITPELKENLIQSNTMVFKTVHQLDMTFLEVTKTAEYHLGYSTEDICRKSWYSMLHPEDIHEAREKHILLIRSSHEMGCMMTVRMLSADGQVLWVNVVMHVRQAASTQNDDPLIVCINQVISEDEAYQIRLQSHMFTLYPPRSGDVWAAAGLSASHPSGHPQHSQPDASARWMPAATGAAPPAPGGSYQAAPVTSFYAMGPKRLPLPTCTTSYPPMHDGTGYQINPSSSSCSSSSPPSGMPTPHGQTDKLKLMLKRKIQGPCRPVKVPKLVWDEHADGSSGSKGLEYAATADPMHSPNSASQFLSGGGSTSGGGYSWPASTQVVPRAQYRVAHVLPMALTRHQRSVKAAMMPSPQRPCTLSPPLSAAAAAAACQVTEQVVPESSVAVPESYLTPDPSPASSPNPQSSVKNEPPECKAVPTSAAILQELEKLASFSRAGTAPAAATAAVAPTATPTPAALPPHVKTEKTGAPECRHGAGRQKELPVMDAFDIESFFDTLDCGELLAAAAMESKRQVQAVGAPKVSVVATKVPAARGRLPAARAVDVGIIKQEPLDTKEPAVLPKSQQQVQSQFQAEVQPPQPQPQPQVDNMELDELLSFFSGDMTATQLDLTDALLTSSTVKEGDALVESVKAFADSCRQESGPCGAGHLGDFLLHSAGLERPLEEFSPVSSSDMSSDVNSDLSGDEDGSSDESLQRLLQQPGHQLAAHVRGGQPIKRESGGDRRGPAPSFSPSPRPSPPQYPQEVPGISEEDELYQLDKLLSSMASNSGMMLSEEPQ